MILAVDPGATGAICAFRSLTTYSIFDTPKITGEHLNKFREKFIDSFVGDISKHGGVTHIIFEEQHVQGTDGGDTILSYGQIGGAVLGILVYLFPEAKIVKVAPATWKAHFKLNMKFPKETPKNERTKLKKEKSAEYLSSILGDKPDWMRGTLGGLKDGRVDSMLIALWGMAYISGNAKLPEKKNKKKIRRVK